MPKNNMPKNTEVMPKNITEVSQIRTLYDMANDRFTSWKKDLTKTAQKELAAELKDIEKSLHSFASLLDAWSKGEMHSQVDKATFIKHLSQQLNEIVSVHSALMHKVDATPRLKDPTIIQSIKSYMTAMIEILGKLGAAIAEFASGISAKVGGAKNSFVAGFDSLKKSVQSMGAKNDATGKAAPESKKSQPDV